MSHSLKMHDVLHVLSLSSSLLSIQRFPTNNCAFLSFILRFFVVKDIVTKEVMLGSSSSGGLYTLPVSCHTTLLSAK